MLWDESLTQLPRHAKLSLICSVVQGLQEKECLDVRKPHYIFVWWNAGLQKGRLFAYSINKFLVR